MADQQKPAEREGKAPSDAKLADVGVPTPESLRVLAEDLPEKDTTQKEIKAGMLADSAQEEARHKANVVKDDGSPNAQDTPSGYALTKVTGVSNDTERGEKYLLHKTARRWGYVPADES